MRTFKVVNKSKPVDTTELYTTIIVTVNEPPYSDDIILHKTGWKESDCEITDITLEEIE